MALLQCHVLHLDPQAFGGQVRADQVGPFQDDRAALQHTGQVQNGDIQGGAGEAVGIGVEEQGAFGAAVFVDDDVGGAGDGVGGTPALGDALDERGLARAEVAFQADKLAGAEEAAQADAHAAGLLGAVREEFEGVGVQNWHRFLID